MKTYVTNLMVGLFLLTTFVPTLCSAYEEKRALANLSHDYTICSAYYVLLTAGLSGDDTVITEIRDNAIASGVFAYIMALNIAEEAGNSEKVVKARLMIAVNEMKEAMDYDLNNIMVIAQQHAPFCKDLLEDPTKRMEYWLNKQE